MSKQWLELAKGLRLGEKRKIMHCGNSPSMTISRNLQGWRGYCHRCSESVFEATGLSTMAELEEYKKSASSSKSIRLPSDLSTNLLADEPTSLLWMTWLLKGGIGEGLRTKYAMGWSKRYGKAVLPIYSRTSTSARLSGEHSHMQQQCGVLTSSTHSTHGNSASLEGLLLRKLHPNDRSPKYVMDHVSPERAVFLSSGVSTGNEAISSRVDCVITEDLLSAIRVGEFVQSAALLGTSLGQGKLDRVITSSGCSNPTIGLWGDPDKAGQVLNRKLERSLTLQGLTVVWLTSPRDPKNMRDYDIRRILSD